MKLFASILRGRQAPTPVVGSVERSSTKSEKTIKLGDFEIDNSNPFKKYEQLGSIDIVADPLDKAALEMASGFKIVNEEGKEVESVNEWATEINLDGVILAICRELLEKGTCVFQVIREGKDITELRMLPMWKITLLTEKEEPGDSVSYVITGEVDKVCLNEGEADEEFQTVTLRKEDGEFLLFRHNYRGNYFKDIMERWTYGIYGRSLLTKIEWRLEMYFDLLESYRKFVNRYGYGRLAIVSQAITKLIEEGRYEEAKKLMQQFEDKLKSISENQDLILTAAEVEQLDTSTGLDIVNIKESLERDIAAFLFSSELGSGKAKGTTYASAYIVELGRIRVLESYRRQIKRELEALLREQFNKKLKVIFDPLDKHVRLLNAEMASKLFESMIIDQNEARSLVGFPEREPAK